MHTFFSNWLQKNVTISFNNNPSRMSYDSAAQILEQVVFSHAAEDGAEKTAKEWNGEEYCMLQTCQNSPITKVQIEIA
jgi:hypothetical protein